MLALLEAVIRGKEDVGVLQLSGCLKFLYKRGDHLVDRQHRLQALLVELIDLREVFIGKGIPASDARRLVRDVLLVEGWGTRGLLVGKGALMTLCRGRWWVGSGGGHVGEEGLLLWRRSSDEVCDLLGEDVGVEVLFLVAVGDHLAVLVDVVIVEALCCSFSFLVGHLGVPLVPAGWDVGRVVRDWRLVLIWVLVEVLAEKGGAVAALLF